MNMFFSLLWVISIKLTAAQMLFQELTALILKCDVHMNCDDQCHKEELGSSTEEKDILIILINGLALDLKYLPAVYSVIL